MICQSGSKLNKLALPELDENQFRLEMPITWTRKTEVLKYGAQIQWITVEIKERIERRIRQSDFPTKPPADRHSTNFTKEHKSPKVSYLWSYRCQVSLFNLDKRNWPIFMVKKGWVLLIIIKHWEKFKYLAYSACLFVVPLQITLRYSGELRISCEWMNNF